MRFAVSVIRRWRTLSLLRSLRSVRWSAKIPSRRLSEHCASSNSAKHRYNAPHRRLSEAMNRAQRVVLILYCLLLAYCCLWVPWRIQIHFPSRSYWPGESLPAEDHYSTEYGWLWVGPRNLHSRSAYATPDMSLIQLRIVAVTSIAAGGFLLSGMLAKSATRR